MHASEQMRERSSERARERSSGCPQACRGTPSKPRVGELKTSFGTNSTADTPTAPVAAAHCTVLRTVRSRYGYTRDECPVRGTRPRCPFRRIHDSPVEPREVAGEWHPHPAPPLVEPSTVPCIPVLGQLWNENAGDLPSTPDTTWCAQGGKNLFFTCWFSALLGVVLVVCRLSPIVYRLSSIVYRL